MVCYKSWVPSSRVTALHDSKGHTFTPRSPWATICGSQDTWQCKWWHEASGRIFTWEAGDWSLSLCYLGLDWMNEVAQSCLTLCDPMDSSLPSFFIHGIFQARVLEWAAISFSMGLITLSIIWVLWCFRCRLKENTQCKGGEFIQGL